MSEELISVLICAYNAEKYIAFAIESALCQTYENIEIIIFNDGSTDNTLNIIKSFPDKRIVVINSSANYGVGKGRQVLKTLARGDYLTFLDADDIFHNCRIEKLLKHSMEKDADIAIDTYRVIDSQGKGLGRYCGIPSHIKEDPCWTRLFERNGMLPHPLIRRNCFDHIQYDSMLKHSDDYDFWIKCSLQGFRFAHLDEVLLDYRIVPGSLSSNVDKSRAETRYILNKYKINDIAMIYSERNHSADTINYMKTLYYLYTDDFKAAFESSRDSWPDGYKSDQIFYQGTSALLCNELDRAINLLEKYVNDIPFSPSGFNNLGVAKRMKGDSAGHLFDAALELLPDYVDAGKNHLDATARIVTKTIIVTEARHAIQNLDI